MIRVWDMCENKLRTVGVYTTRNTPVWLLRCLGPGMYTAIGVHEATSEEEQAPSGAAGN